MARLAEHETSGPWRRALCSVAVICGALVGACGGEARRPSDASPPAPTTDTVPTSSTPACPPPGPPPSLDCPAELLLDVDPRVAETTVSGSVRIEPIQEPEFPYPVVFPPDTPLPDPNPDPATWDRSDVPAGACVFRLWGVNAACYPSGGTFFTESCAAVGAGGPLIAPGSYYDGNECGRAPGCPSAEPYIVSSGYWWYFGNSGVAESGEVFTDLVICAPECANSFAMGGCLRLHTPSSR